MLETRKVLKFIRNLANGPDTIYHNQYVHHLATEYIKLNNINRSVKRKLKEEVHSTDIK